MDDRVRGLREELGSLDKQSKAILDTAENEGRSITAEETQEWDKLDDRVNAVTKEIEIREKQAARSAQLEEGMGRKSDAPDPGATMGTSADEEIVTYDLGNDHILRLEEGSDLAVRDSAEYREAFDQYLTSGVAAGMQVTPDTKGGYITTTRFEALLIKDIDNAVQMRELGTVLPPLGKAVSLGIPTLDTDLADADWTAEVPASDISEDDALRLGTRELMPHLSTKLVKVSEKLLRTAVIPPETLVRQRMAYKFGVTEEKAFLTGDGAQQPLGVFTASSSGISTGQDTTAASTTTFTADELIDVEASIKEGYAMRGTWLMHRDTMKIIRKLKDGNGQYLWLPGIAGGDPATILAHPYRLSEYAPNTFTTGLYVLMFGDFSYYWIADALGMTIDRLGELFKLKNQIGFKGARETDGMPVLESAFARLILA